MSKTTQKPFLDRDKNLFEQWEKEGIYTYQQRSSKSSFVIDTPPPTISGTLHIGHVFSYTQTDIIARFQRMRGKNVFYPMGWDNNGLPTEKRVSGLYRILCDPTLSEAAEEQNFRLSVPENKNTKELFLKSVCDRKDDKSLKEFKKVSRKTFIRICEIQTREDQKNYKQLWQKMALSVDWTRTYETISPHSQKISQISFLKMYRQGVVKNRVHPVHWDTGFQTAVAQADIEDRKQQGYYYDIVFPLKKDTTPSSLQEEVVISTTRPELLAACVALVAHPEDSRYKKLFGRQALSPLFHSRIPICPSPHADPEKGTGILMVCTFGDKEDVTFWKNHNTDSEHTKTPPLPLKQIIDPRGQIKKISFQPYREGDTQLTEEQNNMGRQKAPPSLNLYGGLKNFLSEKPLKAQECYEQMVGLSVLKARRKIVELLKQEKVLKGEAWPTEQFVKFYEKGEQALELLPLRQWYVQLLDYKKNFLEQAKKIKWHPKAMQKRYEQWVSGLNEDWCISRQRFFGVSFPLWYPLDHKGLADYTRPILAPLWACPVDPTLQAPADLLKKQACQNLKKDFNKTKQVYDFLSQYTEDKRDRPGGFTADSGVMDTWATSSLSPQINSAWSLKGENKKLFPADMRPQAHEIIRTWAFYTIVKSFFHEKQIPWRHIVISGLVRNPDRLKMSKSKGGSKTSPEELIKRYSADALRYWAGQARLGQDSLYDENMFKTGGRLCLKLSNAFRFLNSLTKAGEGEGQNNKDCAFLLSTGKPTSAVDRSWLFKMCQVQKEATDFLTHFQYAQALTLVEKAFWLFCDNYIELVKSRAYKGEEKTSALCTLDMSLYMFLKMFAPFLPYTTEELYLKRYQGESPSIHSSPWDMHQGIFAPWYKEIPHKLSPDNLKLLLSFAFEVLQKIRKEKSRHQKSLSTPLKEVRVFALKKEQACFELCKKDLADAVKVRMEDLHFTPHSLKEPEVQIRLK